MLKKLLSNVSLKIVVLAVCLGCGNNYALAQSEAAPGTAKEAIEAARVGGKYLFLFFYDKKDDLYGKMEETVSNFTKNTEQKVFIYEASAKDPKNADIVYKYKIDRAPMPLLMVIGPNGAVLGGFSKSVTADKLAKSLVPPLTMDVLKVVQQQKMAVVLLQNGKTKLNVESSKTATDLAYDKRLLGSVEIVKADPADPRNRDFLVNANIVGAIANATIVLIAPPGIVAGVFQGDATKESIISSISPSGGGCGSGGGGCGPKGCS